MLGTAVKVCGLCGHEMTSERCGSATVGSANGIPLCHHDTHSCYRRWTVYGARPDRWPWNVDPDSGALGEDEEHERSERGR